jgi:ferredoxin-NADP reductase
MEWRETTLADLHICSEDVATLSVERPGGLTFNAGQWLRLEIATDEGPQARTLSVASAPQDALLEFATRISDSAFKRALARMRPGDRVRIAGPGGRLSLSETVVTVGLLVGGVGITPVRSILRARRIAEKPFEDAALFYATRDIECVPFDADLAAMGAVGVRVVHVPEEAPPEWSGERGRIDADIVRRHVPAPRERPWVVAGPPPMVLAMEAVLDELGVPTEQRHVERFGPAQPRVTS